MKSKVYAINLEDILNSKVCVITDCCRGKVYSLGVSYADARSCGLVGMFNSDGELVISAREEVVNGRRGISKIDPRCDITNDDVYAWKCLIQQYRHGDNDLGVMPIHAVERGSVTIQELEEFRKKIAPNWHARSHISWRQALRHASRFCGRYKKKGGG